MTVGSKRRWGERLGRGISVITPLPFGGGVRGRGQLLGSVAGVSCWGQLLGVRLL